LFAVFAELGGVIEILTVVCMAIISKTQNFYFQQALCKALYLENGHEIKKISKEELKA